MPIYRFPSVLFFVLFCSSPACAQLEFGGFFSAAGTWTTVNGSGSVMPSAGVGLILDRRFVLGASLSALIPTVQADSLNESGHPLFINLFSWQGRVEYIHNPDNFFQYGAGLGIGRGGVSFRAGSPDHSGGEERPTYSFTLLEPEIAVSLAPDEPLRLRAALGWRFIPGREHGSEPAGELSGPTITLGFRVGWFGE